MSQRLRALFLLAVLTTFTTNLVSAQNVAVRGRVIEAGATTRIVSAAVELAGVGNTLTDRNGFFVFPSVPRGSYALTLRALGYQSRQVTLSVNRDTTLTLELDVAPVQIDSLVVEQRLYTLRGTVDDRKGNAIIDADVWAGSQRVATNLAGSFKVRRLPASVPTNVRIAAVGYQPLELTIAPQRDTTLRLKLVDDSLGLRMLAAQVKRLVIRSSATPYSRLQFDRARLAYSAAPSVGDFLRTNGVRPPQCFFIDDVERASQRDLVEAMLNTYLPDEFERIEVIDKGTMVRLYTRRYVAKLQSQEKLRPIVLIKMSRPMCQ